MKQIFLLSINDFRMVFRDPLLRIFLWMPLLILVIVRWVVPVIMDMYPMVQPYRDVILMWACMQTSTMFGFINGFIFLEEKDENVFTALRVTPVAASRLVAARMMLGVIVAIGINWMILEFGGLVRMPAGYEMLIAIHFSLLSPLLAMLLAVFSKNKVEGAAQFKIFNLIVNLPILVYFLDFTGLHAFAAIPTYWSFRSVEAVMAGGSYFALFFWIGICHYALYLIVLVRIFERRYY